VTAIKLEIVQEWRDLGIVTDSRSPYASPVMLVPKKDGSSRLVVDFRKLNKQTVKEHYPLPNIDEILSQLHGAKLFCTLDLAQGYLQIPLTDVAQDKTTFVTPDESGKFERMIFGLTNAPSEFQRLLNRVLNVLPAGTAISYLDDILIPAENWEDMIQKLKLVLARLQEVGLTLRISKCFFGKREVEYLGVTVSQGSIRPGPSKIDAIAKFPVPTNTTEIRRFLGLTGYFRKFIRSYVIHALPLITLLRKDVKFCWKDNQQRAFETLRDTLLQRPVLQLFDPSRETELHTDASADGLGAMLFQVDPVTKAKHLVYACSKTTSATERNYHSSKLELLAVVWALVRLRPYLDRQFTLVTDCSALVYLRNNRNVSSQLTRWFDLIQDFDFEAVHRPGVAMSHVDALSRAATEPASETIDDLLEARLEVLQIADLPSLLLSVQNDDHDLSKIISVLQRNPEDRSENERRATEGYILDRGFLKRNVTFGDGPSQLFFVVPRSMRKSFVVQSHDLSGHTGPDRVVANLRSRGLWFPRMTRYVRRHVSRCFSCLCAKKPSGKQRGYLHPIPPPKRPFERIHVDHLGPFPKSGRGFTHVFVVIDALTRYVRLFPVPSTSTQYVVRCLDQLFLEKGLSDVLISDRGTCFTSRQFHDFLNERHVKHVLNAVRHPRANGVCERVNRSLVPMLIAECNSNTSKWHSVLSKCEIFLNSATNATTGKSPFELLYGYFPEFFDAALQRINSSQYTAPAELQKQAVRRTVDEQRRYKAHFDKSHAKALNFDVGQVVFLRTPAVSTGEPTKLQCPYRGPFSVVQALPGDTYKIVSLEDERGNYRTTAHVKDLKMFGVPNSDHLFTQDDDESNPDSDLDETVVAPRPIASNDAGGSIFVFEDAPESSVVSPEVNHSEGAHASTSTSQTSPSVNQRPVRTRRRPDFYGNPVSH
jgi:transposase InsO family protein